MNCRLRERLLVFGWAFSLVVVSSVTSIARADMSFDLDLQADFEFAFLSNTQFNPNPGMTPFLPFQAHGPLTFSLDNEILNPAATTVPFTNVTGQLDGVDAVTGLPFSITPNLEFVGGNLVNIVRDGSDNITSATVENLSMRWQMFVGPPGASVTLFSKVGLPFDGDIANYQEPEGTVISGLDPFEVYLDLGGGESELVAIGRNRTLTVVPEPSTLALFSIMGVGLLAHGLRRRRRRAR